MITMVIIVTIIFHNHAAQFVSLDRLHGPLSHITDTFMLMYIIYIYKHTMESTCIAKTDIYRLQKDTFRLLA